MKDIEKFMQELKELCEKHEVKFDTYHDYEGYAVYLHDLEGNQLTEVIDFDSLSAEPYIDHSYGPQLYREPAKRMRLMPISQIDEILKDAYLKGIKKDLEDENPFWKMMNK